MNGEPQMQTMKPGDQCPDCNVELVSDFMRKPMTAMTIGLPLPGEGPPPLLVRFPILRCPICGDQYPTDETYSALSLAAKEYHERQVKPKLDALSRHNRWVMVMKALAWFLNGWFGSAMFYGGLLFLAQRDWINGAGWLLTSGVWTVVTFTGKTPIDWVVFRFIKRECQRVHGDIDGH